MVLMVVAKTGDDDGGDCAVGDGDGDDDVNNGDCDDQVDDDDA
jgi:hypothetical protein